MQTQPRLRTAVEWDQRRLALNPHLSRPYLSVLPPDLSRRWHFTFPPPQSLLCATKAAHPAVILKFLELLELLELLVGNECPLHSMRVHLWCGLEREGRRYSCPKGRSGFHSSRILGLEKQSSCCPYVYIRNRKQWIFIVKKVALRPEKE